MPSELLIGLKHKLIVSVQAEKHEPLAAPATLSALCESVLLGGAGGLRLANLEVIRLIRQHHPNLPVIGLTKPDPLPLKKLEQVYITPTPEEALSLIKAGASIVATDATNRPRPNGQTLALWVDQVKQTCPHIPLMADCSNLNDAQIALDLGFDCVSTTLSGYTTETKANNTGHPDWSLLTQLIEELPNGYPIILEGRVNQPNEISKALSLGAYTVVVGSAITRPHLITRQFSKATQQVSAFKKV